MNTKLANTLAGMLVFYLGARLLGNIILWSYLLLNGRIDSIDTLITIISEAIK